MNIVYAYVYILYKINVSTCYSNFWGILNFDII